MFDHLGFEVQDINQTIAAMRKENVVISDDPFKLDTKNHTIALSRRSLMEPESSLIERIRPLLVEFGV